MLLFLVGYAGCGKTSTGRRLARRLGVDFVDTDLQIEQAEGASIADIFRFEGEERFRRLERDVLLGVIASGRAAVVSTGGGLPLWEDNMERMNASGRTVYIRRSAESIASRLTPYGRAKRPRLRNLNDRELVEFMRSDIETREPLYGRAQRTVDADALNDRELNELLLHIYNE